MTRDDLAVMVRAVQEIRERCDELLEVLLPEPAQANAACMHPEDKVIDDSTMGEELYRCTGCGAESPSLPIPIQE